MAAKLQLPKIDLSNPDLIPGTLTWDLVSRDVLNSLREYGGFECIHRNLIPSASDLYVPFVEKDGLVEELFNLPVETKKRFVDPRKPYDGYVGGLTYSPLHEMVGINGALNSPAIKDVTHLFWPQGHPKFSDSALAYAKKLQELHVMIKRMVFQELDVEKYLESNMESMVYTFRINKYVAPDTDEDQLGTPIHTDKNLLTILQQNHVHGLEVQTKDGLWFKVCPESPNVSFIVLAGDSFLAWSNGRIHSAAHRVMMRRSDTRYSIGLFSSFRGTVQCPDELVDDEHPLLFKPFDEIEMLRYIVKEVHRASEITLKTYCGV